MSGVITGGWGYVVAAYAVTAAAFLFYGVGLILRVRKIPR